MSLVTIQFNLPDDQDQFRTAIKGVKYKDALREFDSRLRGMAKHEGDLSVTPSKIRSLFWEILASNDADDILD